MAARAGMADLIAQVRVLCNAGTADYTVAGSVYFNDVYIEDALDRYQTIHKRLQIAALPTYASGAYSYTEYPFPAEVGRWVEQNQSGSGWALKDSTGANAPSYTVDYDAQMITFAADTENLPYYLDVRSYDVYRTAGDIWEMKAGLVAHRVNWASDNHDIEAAEKWKHFKAMAAYYKGMSRRGLVAKLVRTDER